MAENAKIFSVTHFMDALLWELKFLITIGTHRLLLLVCLFLRSSNLFLSAVFAQYTPFRNGQRRSINLVDLAGSERLKKTSAKGKVLVEGRICN